MLLQKRSRPASASSQVQAEDRRGYHRHTRNWRPNISEILRKIGLEPLSVLAEANADGALSFSRCRFPGLITVAIGNFADPSFPAPNIAVWEETRHPWLSLPPGTPPKRVAKQG